MKIIRESSPVEFIKKALILVIGTAIMGLGCACYYLGDVGADPTGVLMIGIYKQLSQIFTIEYGNVIVLFNSSLFVILLIFQRKNLYFGTLINAVALGMFINLFNAAILALFPGGIPIEVRYFLPVIGTIFMGVSLAIYIPIDWGASAIDCLILWIRDATKLSYKTVFWMIYAIFIAVGYLMGGVIGYGTVIAAVFTGVIFDYLRVPFKKAVFRIFRLKEEQ